WRRASPSAPAAPIARRTACPSIRRRGNSSLASRVAYGSTTRRYRISPPPDAPARQETIMAKMKLYYSPGSPYARKVRAVAIETKLDKKIEMVNVALTPVAPNADVDKHNPVGKIPVLSVKGMDLFDSPVICEYLDNQHKGRKLLARKGRDRWV